MAKQNSPKNNPILNEATKLAEYIYDVVLKQFGEFSEEKFHTENKLRRSANDLIFYVAQAVGSNAIDAAEYDWNSARKNLLALKTMYVFASQRFIELEPSIVVRMDKLLVVIDKEIARSIDETERKTEKDLEPWLKKYKIWKEISIDKPKLK